MSNDAPNFASLVPGFDFLQDLVKNAGAALPGIGQWVAPTLNPEELEKRIGELRTVQYWLEQNVRMLGATIQALEVQRMTLSTLKSMNVQMGDLREALTAQMPGTAANPAPTSATAAAPTAAASGASDAQMAAATTSTAPAVDPMQWWSALTQQFGQLAANALKDGAAAAKAAGPAGSVGSAAARPSRAAAPTPPAPAVASPTAGAAAKARSPRRRAAAKP